MFLCIMDVFFFVLPHNKPVKQSSVNALTLRYHNYVITCLKTLLDPRFWLAKV